MGCTQSGYEDTESAKPETTTPKTEPIKPEEAADIPSGVEPTDVVETKSRKNLSVKVDSATPSELSIPFVDTPPASPSKGKLHGHEIDEEKEVGSPNHDSEGLPSPPTSPNDDPPVTRSPVLSMQKMKSLKEHLHSSYALASTDDEEKQYFKKKAGVIEDTATKPIKPSVGYILRTKKISTGEKIFINVLHHDLVSSYINMEPKWALDKKGEKCLAYTLIIPDDIFYQATVDEAVHKELCNQALEFIDKHYKLKIVTNSYVLVKLKKGFMPEMQVPAHDLISRKELYIRGLSQTLDKEISEFNNL